MTPQPFCRRCLEMLPGEWFPGHTCSVRGHGETEPFGSREEIPVPPKKQKMPKNPLVLTVPQRRLLLAMYFAGPRVLHHVNELGFKVPLLETLVSKGYAEFSKESHWRGKLTPFGRREAKLLEHFR